MAKGDATRNFYLTAIAQALTAQGEQVLDIASNAICFPCVIEDGDEWEFRKAEKAEKAKAKAAEKARKIERDRKAREVKAKAEQALKA